MEQTGGEKQRDDRAGGSRDFPSHPLAPEARPLPGDSSAASWPVFPSCLTKKQNLGTQTLSLSQPHPSTPSITAYFIPSIQSARYVRLQLCISTRNCISRLQTENKNHSLYLKVMMEKNI